MQMITEFTSTLPLIQGSSARPASDEFLIALAHQLHNIIIDPRGASELALSGVWVALAWCLGGKSAVAMPLFEAGVLELAVASLQKSSPTDWISRTSGGILAGSICVFGWTLSSLVLPVNMPELLLSKGYIDVAISCVPSPRVLMADV